MNTPVSRIQFNSLLSGGLATVCAKRVVTTMTTGTATKVKSWCRMF